MDNFLHTAAVVNTYAWLGLVVSSVVLIGLYFLLGLLGVKVYRRLARVYHMTVITYWLGKLEKEGGRVFQRAQEEDKERIASRAPKAWDQPL